VVDLPDALGQGSWTRLQNVGRFDLVDVPVADRRDVAPSIALRDLVVAYRFTAPRGNDDVRTTTNHLVSADNALLPELGVAKLGEDRIAAGDLDEFFDPANSGDQRVVPFLEEDARPAGKLRGGGADRVDLELEM